MKIAIGPMGGFGGVAEHIRGLMEYSKHELTGISFPKMFMHYSYRVNKGYFPDIYGPFLEKKLLHYDITHAHADGYLSNICAKMREKIKIPKYIHTFHALYLKEESTPKDWKWKNITNRLLIDSAKQADVVISVAKWLSEYLKYEHGLDSIYIPNGCNLKVCECADEREFRQKYGIFQDFVLYVGAINPTKKPELFIKMAKYLPEKHFVMIGKNATMEFVQAFIGEKLPLNIVCLGELSHIDTCNALKACKVFVLPSTNETFGIVILEAMACKKPVVAANNAGPKEIITSGRDGYLFIPDDEKDLIEKTLKAWDTQNMGLNGYETVTKKYDWSVVVKEVDNVYQSLRRT